MSGKNIKHPGQLDFENIRTYPVRERHNLVTIGSLTQSGVDEVPEWGGSDFAELVDRIVDARHNRRLSRQLSG